MKIAIMQPYFFPYIGYFQLINAVNKFVVLDDVNFIKKGWINRNKILVQQNEFLFTLPLKSVSQNKLICHYEIVKEGWEGKFLKTLEYSYKNAPFYIETIRLVTSILLFESDNLSNYLVFQIRAICDYLDISTEIIYTSRKYQNNYYYGQDRIIDICKIEKAQAYINLLGGRNIYNTSSFKEIGIDLYFINSYPIEYKQFGNPFYPSLSIIDVLMFNSKKRVKQFLNSYRLEN